MTEVIEYMPFEEKYYKDIKHITVTSFKLTAFGVDKNINKRFSGKIAWEVWCKPVLESSRRRYCITAIYNKKAVGYIIYGANSEYSKLINKKIGNIILLAVDSNYQGKGIATGLVRYVMDIYKRNNVKIVTVGTDLDNLPAIMTYMKFGFRPILTWSTFRYYFDNNKLKSLNKIKIEKINTISKRILKNIIRPNSLLLDNRLSIKEKKKLKNYIIKNVYDSLKKGIFNTIILKENNSNIAVINFLYEKKISSILNKNVYRIMDIIFLDKKYYIKSNIIEETLLYLRKQYKADIIEIFVQLNNFELINLLEQSGFYLKHNAVTLNA